LTSFGRQSQIRRADGSSTSSSPTGEATATTLAGELPVTRQAVAKHLAVLDRAGLVEGRRRGREVHYAVRPERLDDATRSMARVAAQWDEWLAAIKRIAESTERTKGD
jgi:DNA-binding transcriptional ArsR family regulator